MGEPMSDGVAAADAPPHAKQSLRLWLRLLATTTVVEKAIRSYLRQECGSTLPRFDVLSALDRAGAKLTMSDLSNRLLVSNGNLTGVVARLVEDDLVLREVDPADRRSQCVSLTSKGRREFREMAKLHETLVDDIFRDLSDQDMARLIRLVTKLSKSVEDRLSSVK